MGKVYCEVEQTLVENEDGNEVVATVATCSRCDHQETSFGATDRSVRRCLVMMRLNCPNREVNYYEEA